MTDDGIGRLLVASLHQAVADVLPQRLEYYEHWLSPMGLKEGRGGLAPLGAVLSFLRQEGEPHYNAVMTAAGRYSAEWYHEQNGRGAAWLRVWPRNVRRRLVLRRSRKLLATAYAPHAVSVSVRRGQGLVTVRASIFCTLRETWPWPTCAYLAGAVGRQLELHGLSADVRTATCRAQHGDTCTLHVTFDPPPEAS